MLCRHADDVDDHTVLPRLHARVELAREIDEAEDLELPRVAPFRLVERLDRAAGDVAGVVHQDVDVRAVLGELPQRRAVAEIHRMGFGVATQSTRSLRQPVFVARGEVYAAAFGGEGFGAREADAFRPTGDED